ncbi:MAG: alpha/beta hydrolase [Rhodobacteraceae bacterium]|jgi:pimeloyl-ACP methyl ester carboxylesterase|nr:alpha/beta hydrolase [Paracoccaceae bacterium]
MPEADFDGTRTFWQSWGTGRRAVAVHCSLAHSGAWEGVALNLSDVLHLHAFDIPGHGRSGDWDPARDIMDQTVAVAMGLIGEVPVDLIGHSFGAVACLRVAVERPDLVRSLVLFEPVFFAAAAADGFNTAAPFLPFAEAMVKGDTDAAARLFTGLWGAGERWEDLPARQRAALAARIHLIPAANPALHGDNAGLLAPGRLDRAAMPVLLLEGSDSLPVIPAINAGLARRLPDARRETIPGAGHMGPVTHPAAVAGAIRRHLGL